MNRCPGLFDPSNFTFRNFHFYGIYIASLSKAVPYACKLY